MNGGNIFSVKNGRYDNQENNQHFYEFDFFYKKIYMYFLLNPPLQDTILEHSLNRACLKPTSKSSIYYPSNMKHTVDWNINQLNPQT